MYPLFGHAREHVVGEATLVHYPGRCNYRELVPLLISFVGLFLYVYFSVRKITFIKSKLGLAACSVVTIAAGLSMSMGICFYFGFSLSLQGKEIFPYLVIIVALENILVLTKSVTSTDSRLDVKIRLAQGLSKEGWSITKNLLTEITILTVSLFTFVPFIQEFSIYMIVSLISDYFVQMFFFATVLGIDVSRMEYYSEQKNKLHLKEYFAANNALNWNHVGFEDGDQSSQRMTKSKSHPRLNGLTSKPSDVVANSGSAHQSPKRVPKRIRLVNMWARTRFFQRAFMVWMLVWISMIVYNSGVVEYFLTGAERAERPRAAAGAARGPVSSPPRPPPPPPPPPPPADHAAHDNTTLLLKHPLHARPTSSVRSGRLSAGHWAAVLSQYNASLAGRHLVVLPALLLSHRVSPDAAAAARLPRQRDPPPLRWQALAAALDPIDLLPELDLIDSKNQQQWSKGAELPMYPSTPMEVLLLTILCSISVAVIAYMMVVLYRCICSRHYAEWRASWTEEDEYRKIIAKQPAVQLVMEAVPLVVGGHSQEVECLVTDGEKIVSTCLQGSVHVWDSLNGDLITNIDRRAYFKFQSELLDRFKSRRSVDRDPPPGAATTQRLQEPDFVKLQRPEVRLRKGALNNHLSQLRRHSSSRYRAPAGLSAAETTKYSFAKTFRELYISDEQSVNEVKQVTANSGDGHTNRCAEGGEADWRARPFGDSPVWCADFCNDLIVLGCADGRLEFWEATSSKLKGIPVAFHAGTFSSTSGEEQYIWSTTHKRTSSAESLSSAGDTARPRPTFSHEAENSDSDEVVCERVAQCRAHQQPVTELAVEGGVVLTGGQDHVLKVFSLPQLTRRYTLHGHCGPITSCFIDHASPHVAGSGSQDGLLCVWDLTSVSHEKEPKKCACVAQGLDYMSHMFPLTHTLLVTGGRCGLTVYDLSSGDVIRRVLFGQSDGCVFVRQIVPLKDAIVCDYGTQLRIVRFPLVTPNKTD
ncbi:unnamed protein product [Leptidea sinapis]|uniref:Sterol regulatory element-binding protein cleavage-activating protein n=1 Tax=Leptidea sinapis TaxID=189913 RepID=A0A5E4R4G5_9NEOP|nr:unnamed protein product [Leptidea sinapis]